MENNSKGLKGIKWSYGWDGLSYEEQELWKRDHRPIIDKYGEEYSRTIFNNDQYIANFGLDDFDKTSQQNRNIKAARLQLEQINATDKDLLELDFEEVSFNSAKDEYKKYYEELLHVEDKLDIINRMVSHKAGWTADYFEKAYFNGKLAEYLNKSNLVGLSFGLDKERIALFNSIGLEDTPDNRNLVKLYFFNYRKGDFAKSPIFTTKDDKLRLALRLLRSLLDSGDENTVKIYELFKYNVDRLAEEVRNREHDGLGDDVIQNAGKVAIAAATEVLEEDQEELSVWMLNQAYQNRIGDYAGIDEYDFIRKATGKNYSEKRIDELIKIGRKKAEHWTTQSEHRLKNISSNILDIAGVPDDELDALYSLNYDQLKRIQEIQSTNFKSEEDPFSITQAGAAADRLEYMAKNRKEARQRVYKEAADNYITLNQDTIESIKNGLEELGSKDLTKECVKYAITYAPDLIQLWGDYDVRNIEDWDEDKFNTFFEGSDKDNRLRDFTKADWLEFVATAKALEQGIGFSSAAAWAAIKYKDYIEENTRWWKSLLIEGLRALGTLFNVTASAGAGAKSFAAGALQVVGVDFLTTLYTDDNGNYYGLNEILISNGRKYAKNIYGEEVEVTGVNVPTVVANRLGFSDWGNRFDTASGVLSAVPVISAITGQSNYWDDMISTQSWTVDLQRLAQELGVMEEPGLFSEVLSMSAQVAGLITMALAVGAITKRAAGLGAGRAATATNLNRLSFAMREAPGLINKAKYAALYTGNLVKYGALYGRDKFMMNLPEILNVASISEAYASGVTKLSLLLNLAGLNSDLQSRFITYLQNSSEYGEEYKKLYNEYYQEGTSKRDAEYRKFKQEQNETVEKLLKEGASPESILAEKNRDFQGTSIDEVAINADNKAKELLYDKYYNEFIHEIVTDPSYVARLEKAFISAQIAGFVSAPLETLQYGIASKITPLSYILGGKVKAPKAVFKNGKWVNPSASKLKLTGIFAQTAIASGLTNYNDELFSSAALLVSSDYFHDRNDNLLLYFGSAVKAMLKESTAEHSIHAFVVGALGSIMPGVTAPLNAVQLYKSAKDNTTKLLKSLIEDTINKEFTTPEARNSVEARARRALLEKQAEAIGKKQGTIGAFTGLSGGTKAAHDFYIERAFGNNANRVESAISSIARKMEGDNEGASTFMDRFYRIMDSWFSEKKSTSEIMLLVHHDHAMYEAVQEFMDLYNSGAMKNVELDPRLSPILKHIKNRKKLGLKKSKYFKGNEATLADVSMYLEANGLKETPENTKKAVEYIEERNRKIVEYMNNYEHLKHRWSSEIKDPSYLSTLAAYMTIRDLLRERRDELHNIIGRTQKRTSSDQADTDYLKAMSLASDKNSVIKTLEREVESINKELKKIDERKSSLQAQLQNKKNKGKRKQIKALLKQLESSRTHFNKELKKQKEFIDKITNSEEKSSIDWLNLNEEELIEELNKLDSPTFLSLYESVNRKQSAFPVSDKVKSVINKVAKLIWEEVKRDSKYENATLLEAMKLFENLVLTTDVLSIYDSILFNGEPSTTEELMAFVGGIKERRFRESTIYAKDVSEVTSVYERVCKIIKDPKKNFQLKSRAIYLELRYLDLGLLSILEKLFPEFAQSYLEELDDAKKWAKFRDLLSNAYHTIMLKHNYEGAEEFANAINLVTSNCITIAQVGEILLNLCNQDVVFLEIYDEYKDIVRDSNTLPSLPKVTISQPAKQHLGTKEQQEEDLDTLRSQWSDLKTGVWPEIGSLVIIKTRGVLKKVTVKASSNGRLRAGGVMLSKRKEGELWSFINTPNTLDSDLPSADDLFKDGTNPPSPPTSAPSAPTPPTAKLVFVVPEFILISDEVYVKDGVSENGYVSYEKMNASGKPTNSRKIYSIDELRQAIDSGEVKAVNFNDIVYEGLDKDDTGATYIDYQKQEDDDLSHVGSSYGIAPTTTTPDTSVELAGMMTLNTLNTYDASALKEHRYEEEEESELERKLSKKFTLYKWLKRHGIKLQEIMDFELSILTGLLENTNSSEPAKFDGKFYFLATPEAKQSWLPLLVIEYTDTVRLIHNDKRGGVIKYNGKEYLIVGTYNSAVKDAEHNTAWKEAQSIFKLMTDETKISVGNEEQQGIVLEGSPLTLGNYQDGYLIKESNTLGLPEKSRTLGELLENENSNPFGLTFSNLLFAVSFKNETRPINLDPSVVYPLRGMPRGAVHLLVPVGFGRYTAIRMDSVTAYELIDGSELKADILQAIRKLLNTLSKQTRIGGQKELFHLICFNERDNIYVNENNTITLLIDGKKKVCDLTIMDPEKIHKEILDNFKVRIKVEDLRTGNKIALERLNEAGALKTNAAILGKVGSTPFVNIQGSTGETAKVSPIIHASRSRRESPNFVKLKRGEYVYKLEGDTYIWYKAGTSNAVTDQSIIDLLNAKRRLLDPNNREVDVFEHANDAGITRTYYTIDEGKESQEVVIYREDTGEWSLLSKDRHSNFINYRNNILQERRRKKNAAEKLKLGSPQTQPPTLPSTVTTTPPAEQSILLKDADGTVLKAGDYITDGINIGIITGKMKSPSTFEVDWRNGWTSGVNTQILSSGNYRKTTPKTDAPKSKEPAPPADPIMGTDIFSGMGAVRVEVEEALCENILLKKGDKILRSGKELTITKIENHERDPNLIYVTTNNNECWSEPRQAFKQYRQEWLAQHSKDSTAPTIALEPLTDTIPLPPKLKSGGKKTLRSGIDKLLERKGKKNNTNNLDNLNSSRNFTVKSVLEDKEKRKAVRQALGLHPTSSKVQILQELGLPVNGVTTSSKAPTLRELGLPVDGVITSSFEEWLNNVKNCKQLQTIILTI